MNDYLFLICFIHIILVINKVGGQSSGKSTIVQILSQLTGNKLHVLATNSAMDTTELLGGFEQVTMVFFLLSCT